MNNGVSIGGTPSGHKDLAGQTKSPSRPAERYSSRHNAVRRMGLICFWVLFFVLFTGSYALGEDEKSGFVYIMEAKSIGQCKIGYTKRSPDARLADFYVALPFSVSVAYTFPCRDARRAESLIHKSLKRFRTRGEWFYGSAESFAPTVRHFVQQVDSKKTN